MTTEEHVPLLSSGKTDKYDVIHNHKHDVTAVANGNAEKGQGRTRQSELKSPTSSTSSFSLLRLSSRKKLTFLLLGFANFAACTCFSLLAPFFPTEAAAKDMSPTLIGLVISCFELTMFVSAPFFGKYIAHFGPVFLFTTGQFVTGICSILFGFLNLSPPGDVFTVLCLLVRTITALGAAAFATASIAIIATEFPNNVATVFGSIEIFTGLGYVVGPMVGGALFEAGGFGLPFWVMGGFLLACVGLTAILLPVRPAVPRDERRGSMLRLLASPLGLVSMMSVVFAAYSLGNLDATLAIHAAQFSLNAIVVGVLFMIVAGLYSLTSPVYGWLSDTKNITYPLLIGGTIVVAVSLLIMGPSPLLPFLSTNVWLTVVGLVIMGLSVGACFLPTLKCFYVAGLEKGFEKGLDLDGVVSGLFNSAFHFGGFVGPTVGSAILEAGGYGWCTTVNAFLLLFSALCLSAYVISSRTCFKRHDDVSKMTSQHIPGNTRASFSEHSISLFRSV